jgi:hypothetical protein
MSARTAKNVRRIALHENDHSSTVAIQSLLEAMVAAGRAANDADEKAVETHEHAAHWHRRVDVARARERAFREALAFLPAKTLVDVLVQLNVLAIETDIDLSSIIEDRKEVSQRIRFLLGSTMRVLERATGVTGESLGLESHIWLNVVADSA